MPISTTLNSGLFEVQCQLIGNYSKQYSTHKNCRDSTLNELSPSSQIIVFAGDPAVPGREQRGIPTVDQVNKYSASQIKLDLNISIFDIQWSPD